MSELSERSELKSRKTTVRRAQQRAAYDRKTINAILDAGFVCHVGYQGEHGIVVIPTLYVRDDDSIILHGSTAAGMTRAVQAGNPLTVEVTHLDGIVAARSHMHHSINYRSVVVFGECTEIANAGEKVRALKLLVEHVTPGRWNEARKPNKSEMAETAVIRMKIDEGSAKIRAEGPGEEPEDLELDYWAGVIPVTTVLGTPEPDAVHEPKIGVPDSIRATISKWNESK